MDPNTNLREQLALAREITTDDFDDAAPGTRAPATRELLTRVDRLAELVLALDEWRRKGGFDPYASEPAIVGQAREIARMLRDESVSPTDAVTAVGLDPDDVYSEDSSVFALDDSDNDLIDLSWQGDLWVGVRRIDGVWTVEKMQREETPDGGS